MRQGAEFFRLFDNAKHIPRRAVENPVMHGHALVIVGRKATQFVQPWMFGDPFQKATGLWLTNLPKLAPQNKKTDYEKITQEVWLMSPSEDREEKRSKTYAGVANAFAEQWGDLPPM